MTDTLLIIRNDIKDIEKDMQARILELKDRDQVIIDWCADIAELFHLPSPLLATIGEDGRIHVMQPSPINNIKIVEIDQKREMNSLTMNNIDK